MLGFDFYNKNTIPAWHIIGYDIEEIIDELSNEGRHMYMMHK